MEQQKLGKKALVAWDKIFYFKAACGLNLTSLLEWNVATVSKMLYSLQGKADKLYIKWMNEYYLKGQRHHDMATNNKLLVDF